MSERDPQISNFGDQPVEVRRYVDALRRGVPLIAAAVVIVTVVVVAVSASLPKTYKATARLVYNPASSVLAPTDAESTQRQLATFQAFVQSPTVIATAAKALSESPAAVKEATSSSTESSTNILSISAVAHSAGVASARANAVARAFLAEEEATQNRGFQDARTQLEAEISQLKGEPNSSTKIAALESRISALQISATGTQSELQLGEAAIPPSGPESPRVAVNAVIAIAVSLILAIFLVLARDQLRPRFANSQELGDALRVPVLAAIPYRRRLTSPRRRQTQAGLEREAYDLLQTAVRLVGLPSGQHRVLLVSSATHAEGKTTVTASLGRSLGRAGQKTLLVSGDMRSPALHAQFGLPITPGMSDCLKVAPEDISAMGEALETAIRPAPDELNLDILLPGEMPLDPTSLMSSASLARLFEILRETDYAFIIIDSPPLLGIADAQLLARQADDVLLVGRLDRVSPYEVHEMLSLLARLQIEPLGLAVVGARVPFSPYYTNEKVLTPREA